MIRATQFSQFRGVDWEGEDRDAADAVAVARPDPHADAGRLQSEETGGELLGAVRAAVAGLSAARWRSIELLYGIGRSAVRNKAALRELTGVTAQAIHLSAKLARAELRRSARLRELAHELGLRPADVAD